MNTVQLVGRLTKEVELKYTQSNVAVGTFTLAVNRSFTNQQGGRETDFILCQIWRKAAENLANFTRKGSQIGIEGRIQTRNYENQQGQRVYVTEIIVSNFHLLESREVTEQRPVEKKQQYQGNYTQPQRTQQPTQQQTQQNNFSQPQNQYNYNGDSRMLEGRQVNVQEDDLPF